jgi:hypothetical protein
MVVGYITTYVMFDNVASLDFNQTASIGFNQTALEKTTDLPQVTDKLYHIFWSE